MRQEEDGEEKGQGADHFWMRPLPFSELEETARDRTVNVEKQADERNNARFQRNSTRLLPWRAGASTEWVFGKRPIRPIHATLAQEKRGEQNFEKCVAECSQPKTEAKH